MIFHWRRIWDDTHMTSMKIVQFSRPPTLPPCPPTSNTLPPSWPLTSNFKRTPPPLSFSLVPNDNQSIKRNHNPRMTFLCYQILSSGRLSFSVSIRLSFDFFSFSWSLTICFLVDLCSCVRSCPKISRNVFFIYDHSHF